MDLKEMKDGAKQRLKHRAGLVCSRKSKAILEQKSKKKQDGASLVAQMVKNPPAMRETWVRSLGWEDPLEKGMATHSVIWPGEFHGLYSPWDCKESDRTEQLSLHFMKCKEILT